MPLPGAGELAGPLAQQLVLSSLVCLVVWCICRALGGRLPAFQQALWVLVFLRLLLPPSLSHPLSLGSALRALGADLEALTMDSTEGQPTAGAGPAGPVPVPGGRSVSWPANAAVAAWALGVAVLLAHDLRQAWRLRGLLRGASVLDDPRLAAKLTAWRRRLGIRREVRLVSAAAQLSPFTVGVLRPVLFLPRRLLAPEEQRGLETALAHELAHVARWDALWLVLQRLVSRVYFFHPAVWLASHQLHWGRERLTDGLVLARGLMTPTEYARGLVSVLQLGLRGVAVPGLFTSERSIGMRLRMISNGGGTERPRGLVSFATAALLGAFLLPLGAQPERSAPPGDRPETKPPALASAPALDSPLPGARITLRFGRTQHPYSKGNTVHHAGIDLAAALGTPVLAPADGVVETATETYQPSRQAGTVVVVDHGSGTKSFLAHLGAVEVAVGQRVMRGQTLARVGLTGKTTGPHVHFEVWRGAERVDPAVLVPEFGRQP